MFLFWQKTVCWEGVCLGVGGVGEGVSALFGVLKLCFQFHVIQAKKAHFSHSLYLIIYPYNILDTS